VAGYAGGLRGWEVAWVWVVRGGLESGEWEKGAMAAFAEMPQRVVDASGPRAADSDVAGGHQRSTQRMRSRVCRWSFQRPPRPCLGSTGAIIFHCSSVSSNRRIRGLLATGTLRRAERKRNRSIDEQMIYQTRPTPFELIQRRHSSADGMVSALDRSAPDDRPTTLREEFCPESTHRHHGDRIKRCVK